MDQTRRTLLTRTIPLAAAGGLAGCSALSGDDGTETATTGRTTSETSGDIETGTATPAGGTGGQIDQWLLPPSVVEQDDYAFVTLQPAAMTEHSDALPDERTANLETQIGLEGFETVGTLRNVLQAGIGLTVFDGPFDRSPLVTQLTEAGFSDDGGYQGFDVYSADEQRVVAVGDRQVAQVDLRRLSVSVTGGAVMQAAIDAHTGAGERYQNADDDVATLLSALGAGQVRSAKPSATALENDAALAQGGRWQIGSDTTSVAVAVVFESESATDATAVESWANATGPFGDVSTTVSTDGRAVVASADVSTGDLGPFAVSTTDDDRPEINFGFDYDSEASTVTITHQGGSSVPAERLEIRGDGFADRDGTDQTSSGPWAGAASGQQNTVVAGDSVAVGVTPSYQLLVLYTPETGDGVVLGRDTGPDA